MSYFELGRHSKAPLFDCRQAPDGMFVLYRYGEAPPAGHEVGRGGLPFHQAIQLPQAIRYDPLGYAGVVGLGSEAAGETPPVGTLPWEIGAEPTRAEKRERLWEKAGLVVGVLGGAVGLVLSVRALREAA